MSKSFDIDAEFIKEKVSSYPIWAVRYAISLAITLVLMIVLRPRFVTTVDYDPKKNGCQMSTQWSKLVLFSLLIAGGGYFAVAKYY